MPKQENITSSELKEFVLYDPNTGIFLRKKTLHHKTSHGVDKKCGSINSRGYVTFMVKRKMYQAHRLAWLYMTGRMPSGEIDRLN